MSLVSQNSCRSTIRLLSLSPDWPPKCSQEWPCIPDPLTSTFQVRGRLACAITLSLYGEDGAQGVLSARWGLYHLRRSPLPTGLSITREVTECHQTARVGDGSQNSPEVLSKPMLNSLSRLPGKCPPKRTGHEVEISE